MSGRKKSLSSVLSRRELDDAEFIAAVYEMHMGSDRAAAIMGAALVEHALVEGIGAFLVHREPRNELFYDQAAPFSTFSNRIIAARAMDLVTVREREDLDRIRDVRNQFAHALLPLDFDNPAIISRCDEMLDYEYPDMPERDDVKPARLRYELACCGLWVLITKRTTALYDRTIERIKSEMAAKGLLAADSMPASDQGGE